MRDLTPLSIYQTTISKCQIEKLSMIIMSGLLSQRWILKALNHILLLSRKGFWDRLRKSTKNSRKFNDKSMVWGKGRQEKRKLKILSKFLRSYACNRLNSTKMPKLWYATSQPKQIYPKYLRLLKYSPLNKKLSFYICLTLDGYLETFLTKTYRSI